MIAKSELRIGNYITAYAGKTYGQSQPFKIDGGLLHTGDEEDFEPVLLTPEILEKLGFVWETELKRHLQLVLPEQEINKRKLTFFYDDGVCVMLQFYMEDYFSGYFETKPPQYLHQLQNLYFALTGEELEVKL